MMFFFLIVFVAGLICMDVAKRNWILNMYPLGIRAKNITPTGPQPEKKCDCGNVLQKVLTQAKMAKLSSQARRVFMMNKDNKNKKIERGKCLL